MRHAARCGDPDTAVRRALSRLQKLLSKSTFAALVPQRFLVRVVGRPVVEGLKGLLKKKFGTESDVVEAVCHGSAHSSHFMVGAIEPPDDRHNEASA
jgi:hypothetical protein